MPESIIDSVKTCSQAVHKPAFSGENYEPIS
jgi:hypothetical protein